MIDNNLYLPRQKIDNEMKTLVRHIEIDFSLRFINDSNFVIDLFEDTSNMQESYKITGNGFLVGKFNQIITTQIIFNN